jgi:hypothetical protein
MPLPRACGQNRRTNHAATVVATAQIPIVTKKLAAAWPCDRTSIAARIRSACERARGKAAASSPADTPAKSGRKARTSRRAHPVEASQAGSSARSTCMRRTPQYPPEVHSVLRPRGLGSRQIGHRPVRARIQRKRRRPQPWILAIRRQRFVPTRQGRRPGATVLASAGFPRADLAHVSASRSRPPNGLSPDNKDQERPFARVRQWRPFDGMLLGRSDGGDGTGRVFNRRCAAHSASWFPEMTRELRALPRSRLTRDSSGSAISGRR